MSSGFLSRRCNLVSRYSAPAIILSQPHGISLTVLAGSLV
uniref:(California timema) hypothetical protein n=1 Tax=Timema californicum TaxID=61474 RepID=A0A7R9JJK7_TIMCA|nr:unnamed protein product [Timema californicum]